MKVLSKIIFGILMVVFLLTANYQSAEAKDTVLFDESHGQKFLVGQNSPLDLSGLADLFKNEGIVVKTSKEKISDNVMAGVDILVISGAFQPVSPPEITAIIRFVENGGRLCVMLHIASPVADLLHHLNVSISNGVIREQENLIRESPMDFYAADLKPHELTSGIKRFNVFGGWALLSLDETAEIVAQTSAGAWIDLNRDNVLSQGDAVQAFGLVISGKWGAGRFVVFGDDAIFQNEFLKDENELLGKNLARWLKGKDSDIKEMTKEPAK